MEEYTLENVVNQVLAVDGANRVVVEFLEAYEMSDSAKVDKAKQLIEEGYKLLLDSLK